MKYSSEVHHQVWLLYWAEWSAGEGGMGGSIDVRVFMNTILKSQNTTINIIFKQWAI